MQRFIIFPFLCVLVSACLPQLDNTNNDTQTVTNEEGQQLDAAIQRLNGLWDGQLDQTGALRTLIYNGTVYAFDETTGFYGTTTLNESGASVDINLKRYTFSNTEADAEQYVTGGSATTHYLSGLLFPTTTDDDTMVGDYETSSTFGSFVLNNDGTWDNSSDLAELEGLWTATGYELYITSVGNQLAFREISSTVTGCTSTGFINLIDRSHVIYEVEVTERKNCGGFNVTDAAGYATITSDGDLEFFLRKNSAMLFSHFSRSTTAGGGTTGGGTTDDGTTDDGTTDDGTTDDGTTDDGTTDDGTTDDGTTDDGTTDDGTADDGTGG